MTVEQKQRRLLVKWLKGLRKLPKESVPRSFLVAFIVSIFASILVATSTVLLKPLQVANKENEQRQNLLAIIERHPGIRELVDVSGSLDLEARVVNLATGRYENTINPEQYVQRNTRLEPGQSVAIPGALDLANLKRRAKYAVVYLAKKEGSVKFVILPVQGKGFVSTLYGYIGLDPKSNTVVGLNFYDHDETPGLGAQVSDPEWLDQWQNKNIWDSNGNLMIAVTRRPVSPDNITNYQVNGLSGATWTSRGVHNLVHYWLGEHGFGPYLANLK